MSNYQTYEGMFNAQGLRFAIVCARFNDIFVSQLRDGAIDQLCRHGAKLDDIAVAWVPGSYEIPLVAQKMADSGKYDAIICLGVVIQGSTTHASHINAEVSKNLAQISLSRNLPVIHGVVATENIEQAIERCGSKAGNRGASAAASAIEMANLMKKLP
ncbi:MAG: 6,7-dimethyl-8-ribityllumazine synthase [Oligosphaeraceae bacterium]|nr:6,7-dimethyl-8-ribityllumazine synthase [Oligosphaeraceae bacterium]